MFKFGLIDILLLMFSAAIVVAWNQTPWPEKPKFNTWALYYRQPSFPKSYYGGSRLLPNFYHGVFLRSDYQSGPELFLSNHKNEWNRVAVHFVQGRVYWDDDFARRPALEELSSDTWSTNHELYARCAGRDVAVQQINALVAEHGKDEFRAILEDVPWFAPFLELKWNLFWTLVFVVCVFGRLRAVIVRRVQRRSAAD